MTTNEVEQVIDARGHRCPVPTLRLQRQVEAAEPRALLRLRCDDPMARIDIPHYAAAAGLTVLSLDDRDGELNFLLQAP